MAFEAQYKDDIQSRMIADLMKTSNATTLEGSFSRDIINANSVEFERAYAEMNLLIQACYADTAWDDFLTMRAAEYGVDRKKATAAISILSIKGTAGAIIPANSLFDLQDGSMQFTTNQQVTIGTDGTVNASVTCKTIGTAGNVAARIITHIPMSIAGVTSITNEVAAHDGFDAETDKELLERYMVVVRTPATSGNKYHYYNWAMSIDGIGACRVVPLWAGAGTVKVIVIDSNMQTASADVIKKVVDYIETVRPIGADVTVTSPVPLAINISVAVKGTVDTVGLTSAINAYTKEQGLNLTYISAAQIGKILMAQSTVTDYESLQLNGNDRVTVTDDQLLTCGTVTVNELTI